jgi:acetate kinase
MNEIVAVGHRIVQGGKYFSKSELFNENTEAKIESLIPLAPLHNKAHLVGFRAFKKILPNVTHVAVFDTAFHQTMEPEDYIFPIPKEFTEKYDCRRYGAHGTSHKFLAQEGAKYLPGVEHPRIISCHIGSGASITAIKDGKCVATSMGLTPLGGIMMGTRTGDMDPSVFNYVVKVTVDSLNVRKGPGTNYKILDQIENKGSYTIIKETKVGSNTWGLLKAGPVKGSSWICLTGYTKKVK